MTGSHCFLRVKSKFTMSPRVSVVSDDKTPAPFCDPPPYKVVRLRRRTSRFEPLITAVQTAPWHMAAWWTAHWLMANRLLMYWGVVFFKLLAHLWLIHSAQNKCTTELPGPQLIYAMLCLNVSPCGIHPSSPERILCPHSCFSHLVELRLSPQKPAQCSCFLSTSESDSITLFWLSLLALFRKRTQPVTAISHSVALPDPISSHVDCIRIGRPTAQLEAWAHLSYLCTGSRLRKSTRSGDGDYSHSLWRTVLVASFKSFGVPSQKLFPECKVAATIRCDVIMTVNCTVASTAKTLF